MFRRQALQALRSMIPNLNDLPPILPDEERPLKRLLKPLLGLLMAGALAGGLIWFYTVGLKTVATQEAGLQEGLEAVASDLWLNGKAPEVRRIEPDLISDIETLRAGGELMPSIVVLPSEPVPGRPRSTHELLYMKGNRPLLAIQVNVDEGEGKMDIVSWQVLKKDTPESGPPR
jgi:hypothetical protein